MNKKKVILGIGTVLALAGVSVGTILAKTDILSPRHSIKVGSPMFYSVGDAIIISHQDSDGKILLDNKNIGLVTTTKNQPIKALYPGSSILKLQTLSGHDDLSQIYDEVLEDGTILQYVGVEQY